MEERNTLEWSALEYEERERNSDWYWALGVVIVASSLASIIYNNYFFAALLVLSGILLGFFAIKKPDVVHYELSEQGLRIRSALYPYQNIKSFWVQVGSRPTLFIKSGRIFLPIISIPIPEEHAEEIHNIFVHQNIPEEEMHEHPAEKIMDALGF